MLDFSSSRGRAKLGVLVPFTNTNLEPDFSLLKPEGVSLHFARLGGYDEEEIPDESQMQALGSSNIDEPLHLLKGVKPDVVIYGCTSATLSHGPEFDRAIAEKIKKAIGSETVTAAGALVNAMKHLGIKSIGFCSPYVPAINDLAIDFLASFGVNTAARSEVSKPLGNMEQGGLTPDTVCELAMKADDPNAEAIILSCTDMRSVETIERLESLLKKPVISSNQAMMFQALQILNIPDRIEGFGSLLRNELK